MTLDPYFRGPSGKLLAALTCLVLVTSVAPGLLAQSSKSSMVQGVILDPAGAPSKGFRVVFRDVASNTRYTSTAADAQGNYLVELPVGGRYTIDNVIADDGATKLPVDDTPPIAVVAAGTMNVNVRFKANQAPGAKPAGTTTATAATGPWYKQPGPIIGIVVAAVGVAALVVAGQSGSEASPFTPAAR